MDGRFNTIRTDMSNRLNTNRKYMDWYGPMRKIVRPTPRQVSAAFDRAVAARFGQVKIVWICLFHSRFQPI
jgi:hypothetical protein